MAKTVEATALEAFEWNGRSFSPGEPIHGLPIVDALVLLRKRAIHVPLTRKAKPPATQPVEKMPASRSRRRYRRSDMQAETAHAPAAPLPAFNIDAPFDPSNLSEEENTILQSFHIPDKEES